MAALLRSTHLISQHDILLTFTKACKQRYTRTDSFVPALNRTSLSSFFVSQGTHVRNVLHCICQAFWYIPRTTKPYRTNHINVNTHFMLKWFILRDMEGVMLQWGQTSQRMPFFFFGKKVRQEKKNKNKSDRTKEHKCV